MHLGVNNSELNFSYKLLGRSLERVKEEKDIGVVIDENLTFDLHIAEKVKKATAMSAMIFRIFKHINADAFIPLYKALVRTQIEYACLVWAPYKAKHNVQIESVQRRSTRQIPKLKHLSYEERLRTLKLPILSYRRKRGGMIEVYKIINNIYDPDVSKFIKLWSNQSIRHSARGKAKKIFLQISKLNIRKHGFSLRIVRSWNSLPDEVINAENVNSFKNKLDKFWSNKDIIYNYKAKI